MSTIKDGGPAFPMQEARDGSGLFQYPDWRTGIALDAYQMADAMLAARAKGGA